MSEPRPQTSGRAAGSRKARTPGNAIATVGVGLLRLCRLYYAVPMALTYLLTVYYARGVRMDGHVRGDALSAVALGLIIAAAYALNDACDVAVDRINAPGRPVPAGAVPRGAAVALSAVLAAAGLVLAAGEPRFLAALAVVAGGLAVYDVFSKRLGWGKPLLVAVLMTSIYPLALARAGGAVGPRAGSLAFFPAFLLPTAFAYELLKDLRDLPGDLAAASRSLVGRRPRRWRRVANGLLTAPCVLLAGPLLLGCGWVYAIGAVVATALAVAAVFATERRAIRLVYAECFLLAVAAALDVFVLGV